MWLIPKLPDILRNLNCGEGGTSKYDTLITDDSRGGGGGGKGEISHTTTTYQPNKFLGKFTRITMLKLGRLP